VLWLWGKGPGFWGVWVARGGWGHRNGRPEHATERPVGKGGSAAGRALASSLGVVAVGPEERGWSVLFVGSVLDRGSRQRRGGRQRKKAAGKGIVERRGKEKVEEASDGSYHGRKGGTLTSPSWGNWDRENQGGGTLEQWWTQGSAGRRMRGGTTG